MTLGALDVEEIDGRLAAILPDGVTPDAAASALGVSALAVSSATARDEGSVWVLRPRPVRVGALLLVPADHDASPGVLRLHDTGAFGTGLHPTTALCIEALEDAIAMVTPSGVLDVGVGSGVLALAALARGVPRAVGVDIDAEAVRASRANAELNGFQARIELVHGGPDAVTGTWPLVLANVLAAPLIEMAPTLVRRLDTRGRLILSGIPEAMTADVDRAFRRLGLRHVASESRAGWSVLVLDASW